MELYRGARLKLRDFKSL
jgi:hypothetical protein